MKLTYLILLFAIPIITRAQTVPAVEEIYKIVKYQDQAIDYRANIQVGACNFELLINDVPVEQFFGNANGTFNTSTPINDAILKSGSQRWKLILYPGYKNDKPIESLSANVFVDIEIEALKNRGMIKKIPEKLLETTEDGKYKGAGEKQMVYEGTFEATVPYNLKGWSESVDLRKENQQDLLKKVLAFYEEYADVFKNKDEGKLNSIIYNKEKELQQCFFMDRLIAQNHYKLYTVTLERPNAKVLPIEKYKLRFYGDGRLVTLERTDFPNVGEPVVRIQWKKGNEKNPITEFMYAYLHMRSGSSKLEMIR